MKQLDEKGFIKSIPEGSESNELSVGLELTVRGELADMWLLERHDGSQTYFPKDHFQLYSESDIREHITDVMSKVDDVIQLAERQGKSKIIPYLQNVKDLLNDLTMEEDV